jgi:hypothetical protein
MGTIQLSYLAMSYIQNIPPLLTPYIGVGFVNGINILVDNNNPTKGLPTTISILGYETSFINNFNVMFFSIILPPIIGFILYVIALKSPLKN